MPLQQPATPLRTRSAAAGVRYMAERLNSAAGSLRVVLGSGVTWTGTLLGIDAWRRWGTRTRSVGSVQWRLGMPAAAIERLATRHAARALAAESSRQQPMAAESGR